MEFQYTLISAGLLQSCSLSKKIFRENYKKMKNFTFFDVYDYTILILLVFIFLFTVFFAIKRTRKKQIQTSQKVRRINIIVGTLTILISISWFYRIGASHDEGVKILQPVSMMTSKPFVLMSVLLFLIGLALILMGVNQFLLFRKTKTKI